MNKLLKQIIILMILTAVLILPYFVFAGNPALDKLIEVGSDEGPYATADETTVSEIAGTAVKAFLSLLGVIFIILMIYAGHLWMTASGREEQLTKAKETLWRAIIGLIIVIGAYAIWEFLFVRFVWGIK